jgi:hypothetical protein
MTSMNGDFGLQKVFDALSNDVRINLVADKNVLLCVCVCSRECVICVCTCVSVSVLGYKQRFKR